MHLRPTKLVVTVPEQVEQEPQLLHDHPVHVKTQTLNIAENSTCKLRSRENRLSHDQHIQSYQSEDIGDQTTCKTELHREITPHTTTTMTSWKDRRVFENSNILPASQGLKAIISENQRNQLYQS